jgi:hypothetical protein
MLSDGHSICLAVKMTHSNGLATVLSLCMTIVGQRLMATRETSKPFPSRAYKRQGAVWATIYAKLPQCAALRCYEVVVLEQCKLSYKVEFGTLTNWS